MTAQPPLFLPGWDVEPCDTAEPPPATERCPYRRTVTVGSIDNYEPQEQP